MARRLASLQHPPDEEGSPRRRHLRISYARSLKPPRCRLVDFTHPQLRSSRLGEQPPYQLHLETPARVLGVDAQHGPVECLNLIDSVIHVGTEVKLGKARAWCRLQSCPAMH